MIIIELKDEAYPDLRIELTVVSRYLPKISEDNLTASSDSGSSDFALIVADISSSAKRSRDCRSDGSDDGMNMPSGLE